MPNSTSIFDTLYIVSKTEDQYDSLSLSEVTFLSYFACLLSLYKGNPVSVWEYSFMRNEQGVPVSAELAEACSLLIGKGQLEKKDAYYHITGAGKERLSFMMEMELFKSRQEYLQAACDCLLTGTIAELLNILSGDSVITESSVHTMKYLNSEDNSAISRLHQQFGIVRQAIGERKNLFIPALSWLEYLKQELE